MPPDGGWGWLVCIACLVGNLKNAAITMSFGVILPELKNQFKEGTGMISFVGSLMCGLVSMTMPLAAVFAKCGPARYFFRAVLTHRREEPCPEDKRRESVRQRYSEHYCKSEVCQSQKASIQFFN